MGRKRPNPLLTDIRIEDIAAEGNAIARVNNMALFVPMAIPGDICDVQVIRKRKNYMEGYITRIISPSPLRIQAHCEHFGVCGGCKWQHLPYQEQLKFKQKQVSDSLERIGKVTIREMRPILGSEQTTFYRNKLEYTFSAKRWLTKDEIATEKELIRNEALGFHIPGMFDKVLDIVQCHHQEEPSNKIRLSVKEYALNHQLPFFNLREQTGLLRNLIIRNNLKNEFMVILVFAKNDEEAIAEMMNHLKNNFSEIKSLQYVINNKANDTIGDLEVLEWSGSNHLIEEMEGLKFRIGPKSFYQTNSRQAYRLYQTARELANIQAHEVVYDLYTGTGTIALFVARQCRKVVGIEYVPEAISDAKQNALLNHIDNADFFAGDMKDVLTEAFIQKNEKPDVMIIDPPRAGMHEKVIEVVKQAAPQRIVYVSCNPATQARDLNLLSDIYSVEVVQPVDMFPHTHHVENVVLLKRI